MDALENKVAHIVVQDHMSFDDTILPRSIAGDAKAPFIGLQPSESRTLTVRSCVASASTVHLWHAMCTLHHNLTVL